MIAHESLLIHNGVLWGADGDAILTHGDVIQEIGASHHMAAKAKTNTQRIDAKGQLITPGLIDCHTHLVFSGNRAQEFEARLAGASYKDIAASGGGIMASVRATRIATIDDLIAQSLPRLDALIAEGVTTVEIKSGYGLSLEVERRCLQAARHLGQLRAIDVVTTFLGAHALPPEFQDKDSYIDHLCTDMLPRLAAEGLVDQVDGFCEGIAFSACQLDRLFGVATSLGLRVKVHAEQLSNSDGALLAAKWRALSADHLEWLNAAGIEAMAQANVSAVLLPGAFYCLRETQKPPVAQLRAAGVPIAVATDLNPGTSPLCSPILAMNMACVLFGLSVAESLEAMTSQAARALSFSDRGHLRAGQRADIAIWDATSAADLVCRLGGTRLKKRIVRGRIVS